MKLIHASHMRKLLTESRQLVFLNSGHDVSILFQVQWLTLVHQILQEGKVVGVGYQDVPNDH